MWLCIDSYRELSTVAVPKTALMCNYGSCRNGCLRTSTNTVYSGLTIERIKGFRPWWMCTVSECLLPIWLTDLTSVYWRSACWQWAIYWPAVEVVVRGRVPDGRGDAIHSVYAMQFECDAVARVSTPLSAAAASQAWSPSTAGVCRLCCRKDIVPLDTYNVTRDVKSLTFVCLFVWGLTALSAQIGYIAS